MSPSAQSLRRCHTDPTMKNILQTFRPYLSRHLVKICILVLSISLMATNRFFTAVDDECTIIDRAAKPVSQTIQLFLRGIGEHEHPPLYDLILHVWLRVTGGE